MEQLHSNGAKPFTGTGLWSKSALALPFCLAWRWWLGFTESCAACACSCTSLPARSILVPMHHP